MVQYDVALEGLSVFAFDLVLVFVLDSVLVVFGVSTSTSFGSSIFSPA
jgi:hypothetical protein